MTAYSHHIFVCGNQRADGHPRGCCDASGNGELRDCLKKALKARGLDGQVRANQAGCLDQCELGPTLVIYPQGIWYGGVTPADVPRIVEETIIGGKVIEDLRIPDEWLNTAEGRAAGKQRRAGAGS